ncbi:unnamed protein product [Gemmataceae bacterium]|nr:unnamed protein product [Gemmataceae bacterium]VTT96570.1 unnamed protein product [Gemmataceae bacterium]
MVTSKYADRLRLLKGRRLTFRDSEARAGKLVWRALWCLFTTPDRRVPVGTWSRAVWGWRRVEANTQHQLAHRINEMLAGVGYPARVAVEDGFFLLV